MENTMKKPIISPLKRPQNRINFEIHAKKPNLGVVPSKFYRPNILQTRQMLPVYKVKRRLLEEIDKHPTLIIIGETGCGKTTQIPQFIHDVKLEGDKMIGITQPRRVAAITVAQRVALETSTSLGKLVGYTVRFEDTTSDETKIKYLTDGMLLREAMLDENLTAYSIIILDEAHERTVQTDVLFGIVKKAQQTRSSGSFHPLKVILMSATMDVDHFSKYFNEAVTVYLEGRTFPVTIHHAAQPQDDYAFSCLVTIFQINKTAPVNDDILVFLTGQEEIESLATSIRSICKDPDFKGPYMRVFPLYASLSTAKQLDVFKPCAGEMRKVILSTNIAETSVTISGVRYIIDSGMVKVRTHQAGTGLDVLKVQRISQAQAWQRAGRAGREAPGACYRVYTQQEFDMMMKNTTPEIQRCNLSSVVLQLTAINIDPLTFDFLDRPPTELIKEALHHLGQLGAVENDRLTTLGRKMAQFPLDPAFSRVLLAANDFKCLDEMLSLVSVLSSECVFVTSPAKKEEAKAARIKFLSPEGDHITLLNIFRCYRNIRDQKKWCFDNFLNARNLEYAAEVRTQLVALCERAGFPHSSCGQNLDTVRKCLIAGLFNNIAELQRDKHYITIGTRQQVQIHPSSSLFGSLPPHVLFTELIQTGKCYMRNVSVICPEWLQEVMPSYARLHPLRQLD
ncbi:ATP-dependent RNA helicase DHX33 [Macrosteles quadrilineatus]|uniref:ATP-dependent RNA helicase DHX33 n=1 Tax=Macrosteles quadrilineatus TaxID=74068 RepID=UPI0023E19F79|nr:ATP-dependent RNA helicase DHX33 [Macrosteles quadrilineatus]